MKTEDKKRIIDHLMNHSVHRAGIVYDFIAVCSSMMNISQEFEPGVSVTVVEMNAVLQIAEHPGITAGQLCRKWKRTRSALAQLLKKLEQKGLIYKEKSEKHDKIMLLYPTVEGIKLRNRVVQNETNDTTHLFSSLIDMGCSPEELEGFYKVMDCYTALLLQHPEMGWYNLIGENK